MSDEYYYLFLYFNQNCEQDVRSLFDFYSYKYIFFLVRSHQSKYKTCYPVSRNMPTLGRYQNGKMNIIRIEKTLPHITMHCIGKIVMQNWGQKASVHFKTFLSVSSIVYFECYEIHFWYSLAPINDTRRMKSKSQRVRAVSLWTQWCPESRGWVTPGRLSFVQGINVLFKSRQWYQNLWCLCRCFFSSCQSFFCSNADPIFFGHKIFWYRFVTFFAKTKLSNTDNEFFFWDNFFDTNT